jgi:putative endonuclease
MYYAYMLRCADGTIYSGYAADMEKRIHVHNAGRGAKYTRARLPVFLAHCEAFEAKGDAMKRERAFKRMTRGQKLALCETIGT